ncbi:hypothetical protein AYO41_02705 [Verrucomicrobia bacterium SCGC AG-212-E04]|nr:hypothetical protein AYO41_02705 [Verrucomicrobia bacterium SCGC AG-212-E04]
MNKPTQRVPPKLGKPGAGLPFLELFVARHFLLPRAYRRINWDGADAMFQKQGRILVDLTQNLSADRLQKPVLIGRIAGIEDSSRFWSPGMVLEHLIIVGSQMMRGIVELSRGLVPAVKPDVAAVKPTGSYAAGAVGVFRSFLAQYADTMKREVVDRNSPTTLVHPWFGAMNARQWHCLAALHQGIHRKQMQKILAK